MKMLKYAAFLATALVALAACAPDASDTAADAAEPMMISAAAVSAEYVPVAGFPQGADLSVVYGDPSAGAFEMYFRLQPGVRVPMHFHT